MSNPTDLEVADLWLHLPKLLFFTSSLATAIFLAAVAAAVTLVLVSSHVTKHSVTKGIKVLVTSLVLLNLFILWFGPSLTCYRRILETMGLGKKVYRVEGEVTNSIQYWQSSGKTRQSRYRVTLRTPEPESRQETYETTYDSYLQAQGDTRIRLACLSSRTCWLENDFREFIVYLWAISIVTLVNICVLIGVGYLLWHWRIEIRQHNSTANT